MRLIPLHTRSLFLAAAAAALLAAPVASAQEGKPIAAPTREQMKEDSDKAHAEKAVIPAKENPGAKRDETHEGKDPISTDAAAKADAKPLTAAEKNAEILAGEEAITFNSADVIGAPTPGQIGYQEAQSPVMQAVVPVHNYVLGMITVITIFVLVLLAIIVLKFNKKKNPVPATFTHNKMIEIIWTVIPILLLVSIAIPSLRLHYNYYNNETIISNADLTVKVVGHQWYWSYEYPDQGIAFDSNIKADNELLEGEPRLLAVDNPIVVPAGKVVRVQLTSADVIHAWAIPSFGIKKGAIPGRLNETWFKAEKEGIYYGQCSVLCGKSHGFMPIAIYAVSQEKFDAWVKGAKLKFADNGTFQIASN